MYDIAIIGAGVTGAMLARELSRFQLSVCLLEGENDVSCGASKANSAIVHSGLDPVPGTLKARLNVQGVPLMEQLAGELDVPFVKNGSMVAAFNAQEANALEGLLRRGRENGVPGLSLLTGDEARALEPNLSPDVTAALLAPSSGIICPYELTCACVGNAMDNGAELLLNFPVQAMEPTEDGFAVSSPGRTIRCRYLVNCAGCGADAVAALLDDAFFTITPRKGEYLVLDKSQGGLVSHTIFQAPTAKGKGVLVTPTVDGNLLAGPTAVPSHDTDTTPGGLGTVAALCKKSVPAIRLGEVITSFAGLRASYEGGDFIIEPSHKHRRLLHVAAIDSPGLTASPAIARYALNLLKGMGLALTARENPVTTRQSPHHFRTLSREEKNRVIAQEPAYGRVVCRCEGVTEGEILAALRQNPRAADLDGVKRRVRAGMGRCQGGFCSPRVMELIAGELGVPLEEVTKKGPGSHVAAGRL